MWLLWLSACVFDEQTYLRRAAALGDADGDGFAAPADCDDTDNTVFPGAVERCNGVDDDCSGDADSDATDRLLAFTDADGDGFGDGEGVAVCALAEGQSLLDGDCDDTRRDVHPTAFELCNGRDDDCDGVTDPPTAYDASIWYIDRDGDGFGDPTQGSPACEAPEGTCDDGADCDDTDNTVYPGAVERCNGVDDDCDGLIDPPTAIGAALVFLDADEDGFGTAPGETRCPTGGWISSGGDCDDANTAIGPGGREVCDGADNNCDGLIDEGVATTYFADLDGDSFGGSSFLACEQPDGAQDTGGDCDDTDNTVYPDSPAFDEPNDGVDQNCDGSDTCRDFNCDGYPDFALLSPAAVDDETPVWDTYSDLYVFGSGLPVLSSSFRTRGAGAGAVGDLNGDGYPDLVVAQGRADWDASSGGTTVFFGSAAGLDFASPAILNTFHSTGLRLADLDADGRPEVLVGQREDTLGSNDSAIAVFESPFVRGQHYDPSVELAARGPGPIWVGDLDGDHRQDVVSCGQAADAGVDMLTTVYWHPGTTGDRVVTHLAADWCVDLGVHDLNNDGCKDLLVSSSEWSANAVFGDALYTGAIAPNLGWTVPVSNSVIFLSQVTHGVCAYSDTRKLSFGLHGVNDMEVGDIDHDGLADLVLGGIDTTAKLAYGCTAGTPGCSSGLSPLTDIALAYRPADLELVDVNDDGRLDLAICSYSSGSSGVLLGTAAGFSTRTIEAVIVGTCEEVEVVPVDDEPYLLYSVSKSGTYWPTSWTRWTSTGMDTTPLGTRPHQRVVLTSRASER